MPRRLETDRWLFLATVALCLIGAVMVFSASAMTAREQFGSSYHFLLRQAIWLFAGLAGMLLLMNVDYRKFRNPPFLFSGLFVVLLLLVGVFFLDRSHATHRWIRVGPASLQPSEFAKLVVIFYLAWFLELRIQGRGPGEPGVNDWRHSLVPAVGPVIALACLVVFEPDLGTAVQIFIVAFALLFAAGLSWVYVGGAGGFAAASIVLLIVDTSYRYQRVVSFLNPTADPQGRGFQLMQSLIAVGSGGLTGVGLMESKQKLFYLPEASTDFIFAVICEELGFLGAIVVLTLFAVYAWRGIRAALGAPDMFGRLVALGITVMVISQALINLGVVLGMMPTKGIPLPFISYGGSSLLVVLLATGVLLNISQHAD
jgi:cell division protein FtsW